MKVTPKAELLIDMTNPINELEQVISYVVSNQPEDQRVLILERLNKSINEAIEQMKATATETEKVDNE